MDQLLKIKHLYARAGFGIPTSSWKSYVNQPLDYHIEHLFYQGKHPPITLRTVTFQPRMRKLPRQMSAEERKKWLETNQSAQKSLNTSWIQHMYLNENPLLEKMSLFWHDHFACRIRLYPTQLTYIDTIRKHALGNFRDLLFAISKDAGMIRFLNNQQNKKEHPNENFARELLELFTLGRGQYTELDIKEAARAFTGWSSNLDGEFIFRSNWHDTGSKTFLGREGHFNGEDILEIILAQKQTSVFIVEKLYKYLVNPTIQPDIVKAWAYDWYENDYDISYLLKHIFSSDHFYESQNIGSRIKSPIEYLVSMMQILQMEFEAPEPLLFIQKVLGQILFVPPNVSGWPEETAWIDSSSLMARLHIPAALITGTQLALSPKQAFSSDEDPIKVSARKALTASINWESLHALMQGLQEEELFEALMNLCFMKRPEALTMADLRTFIPYETKEQQLKALMARLLGTPEFNLC